MNNTFVDHGFQLEEWHVEPGLGRMIRDQVVVTLRPRVMEALVLFAKNPGAVVSKRELVDTVWSSGFVAENTVVHCIKELRNALGDSAACPQYLETIPRRGYRLLAQVRPIETAPETESIERARYQLVGQRWIGFLIDGENLIGRGGEARIVAPSVRVSRHHARIVVSGQSVTIEDLESKNGTFVSNRRVVEPTPIEDGDRVRIGDVSLRFCRRAIGGFDETVSMEST